MSRTFAYYDDWRNQVVTCECGWRGPLRQEDAEPYAALLQLSCPECDRSLAVVHYPSDEERLARANTLDGPERAELEERRRFLEETQRDALKHARQLPELEGDPLDLLWDFAQEGASAYTLIRLSDTVVWKEPAIFEGAERFEQVAAILKARYGTRLHDLRPSEESHAYLYGDELSAPDRVDRVRRSLRE